MAKTRRRGRKSGKRRYGSRRRMRGGVHTTQLFEDAYGNVCHTRTKLNEANDLLTHALQHIDEAHAKPTGRGSGRFSVQEREDMDAATFGPIIGGIRETKRNIAEAQNHLTTMRKAIPAVGDESNKKWKAPDGVVDDTDGCWLGAR